MRNHNVFHESLLDHYTPQVRGQPSSEPNLLIVNETEEWEVDHILSCRGHSLKVNFLIQLASYNPIAMRWESADHIDNA